MSATDTCTQQPKFSRYRSVRRAAAAAPIPEDVPAIPEEKAQLNRAPSRYHRGNRARVQAAPLPAALPCDNATTETPKQRPHAAQHQTVEQTYNAVRPTQRPLGRSSHEQQKTEVVFTGGPVQSQQPANAASPTHERQLSRAASNATRSSVIASPKSYQAAREEARMILEGEYDRIEKLKELQKRYEPKNEIESAALKRQRTQKQQPKPQPVYVDAPKLTVKRKVERIMPDKYHDAPQSVGQKHQSTEQPSKRGRVEDAERQTAPTLAKSAMDAPTRAIPVATRTFQTPQFDAPISAVNAGERRVEIRLNNAERGITLPVTPTTNAKDLLNSASIVMSEDFDPRSSVLVESFSKVGLERPLRRYEHIRDVMNSWDTDDQNYLSIMTEHECQATGLDRGEAPEDVSGRVMLQMHLSLRPGKWDKRWVILRPDGQVTMSKQENDGEGTNICHLSDFDVYTPTAKQRKKLKPPKKHCFAVKSQQKSAMFLEGVNFVHFFSTGDKQIADQWYTAIQTWRSWYLVHVLGEGVQKPKEPANLIGNVPSAAEFRPTTAQSTDSTPYQLGSFKPLLDFSDMTFDFDTKAADASPPKKPSVDLGTGRMSNDMGTSEAIRRGSRQRGAPPTSFPAKLFTDVEQKGRVSLDNNDQGFTGGGLLGRSISTRRPQGGKPSGQGVAGPPGKPLVDLTPASEFLEGSLLRKLEAWSVTQGEYEPKIDRHRRVEAEVKVGEGLG